MRFSKPITKTVFSFVISLLLANNPLLNNISLASDSLVDLEPVDTPPVGAASRTKRKNFDQTSTKIGGFIQGVLSKQKAHKGTNAYTIADTAFIRSKYSDHIQIYITTKSTVADNLHALTTLGVEIEVVNKKIAKIQGWAPLAAIDEIADLDFVTKISAPLYGHSRKGSVTTEGDTILKSNQLRALGFSGKGTKVGVISDGSNDWTSARDSGDLPANVTRYGNCSVRTENIRTCVFGGSTCNEGTAMAEIIHDIAPDAELAISSVSTSLEFIQRINQLATEFKADIIVDDLGFYGEPYFEDGDLAQAVTALPDNILYVSSAGNSAQIHYENDYRGFTASDANSYHNFGASNGEPVNLNSGFLVRAQSSVVTLLQWNDRFDTPSNDYDLYVVNRENTEILNRSIFDQTNGAAAIEATCTFNETNEDVVQRAFVNRFSGSSKRIEMFHLGAGGIQYPIPEGSVFGHPGVPRAIAVGTINSTEPNNDEIAFYSSHGPSRIDFPTRTDRLKPDITGIDGVSVTGAGGFRPTFFGTSAAAPHVAGIAAQLLSSGFKVKPENVRTALLDSAVDLGASGRDPIYGFGRVDALLAEGILIKGGNPVPALLFLLDD